MASEVIREALRSPKERDEMAALQREAMRASIAEGIAQAESGQVVDGEQAVSRVRAKIARKKKTKEKAKAR